MSFTCGAKTRISAFLLAISAVVVLLATMAIPSPVYAAGDSKDSIRVGYYENEVFQEGAREGAVKTGYAYEYYRKLSEYAGWKYEYVYGDYGALYQKLLDGDIDLLAGLAWREDRVGLIGYPDTPMGNEVYSLVKHGADQSIDSNPATLSGKKIGVLDSALVGVLNEYLDKNSVKAEVVTFGGYEELFAAFDSHEVDVLAAEGDGAYGRSDAQVIGSIGSSDYFLCVNVKRPDLLAVLNEAKALGMQDMLIYDPLTLLTNSLDTVFFLKQGVQSCVLARELTLEEITEICKNAAGKVDLQLFGPLIMAVSRRKYLQSYFDYAGIDEDPKAEGGYLLQELSRREYYRITENEKESIVYTKDFAAPYKEYLQLQPLCQRVILCGDHVKGELLLRVLQDLQDLTAENAEEKRRQLQEDFPQESFNDAYLYRRTNLRK
ncbi:MAG: U32 family peptidase [Erysipelotrichaceae bacterium]|nr:U32 family peptidase [Erysipelotrichaceae bacterium]